MWLSVIQLWHYLFIGILNSMLTRLARNTELGRWEACPRDVGDVC